MLVRIKQRCVVICILCFLSGMGTATAEDYMTREQFLSTAFGGESYDSKKLWLDSKLKLKTKAILGHELKGLRVRYWQNGSLTAWVFDVIGKEMPITVGVTLNAYQVKNVKILAFRESRGGEVRHGYFLEQYNKAALNDKNHLTETIDGITGATLSVRAVTNVTRLALMFNQYLLQPNE